MANNWRCPFTYKENFEEIMSMVKIAAGTVAILLSLYTPAMSANFTINNPADKINNPAGNIYKGYRNYKITDLG
jgi:hypothetical protein